LPLYRNYKEKGSVVFKPMLEQKTSI